MNAAEKERDAIETTAAEWLARRDRGFTAEEAVMFARWQMADARHRAAVEELELTWGALDDLSVENSQQRAGDVAAASPAPISLKRASGRRSQGQWWAAWGVAAALAIVAAWWAGRQWANEGAMAVRFETEVGGQRTVRLADGSDVQLNTDTAVVVRIERSVREVTLERGEAFFQVAKDASRPFVVWARGVEARALGTAFALRVREHTGEIEVLVTEGRVSFGRSGGTNPKPVLERGQRGMVTWMKEERARIATLGEDAIARMLAWQTGRLVLVDMPLAEAVAEMNRYQRQQLVLRDAGLADERVGGTFKIGNGEDFVRLLEAALPVVVTQREGNQIVLARRL